MSTHAAIAIPTTPDHFEVAYLHFDGYKEHALEALASGFSDPAEAVDLVSHGDLRCIAADGSFEVLGDALPPASASRVDLERVASDMGARFVYVLTPDSGWVGADLTAEPLPL